MKKLMGKPMPKSGMTGGGPTNVRNMPASGKRSGVACKGTQGTGSVSPKAKGVQGSG